jgi:isocitrate dehydrogenase (NAD+)
MEIARVAGDGVGQELVAAGARVIESLGLPVTWVDLPAGYSAYEEYGTTAPPHTLEELRRIGLAIKGPFRTPNGGTVHSANHYIRHHLGLYAAVRPIAAAPGRPPILLVREQLEDLYGAIEWMATADVAQAVKVASRGGCERIARYAFELARSENRGHVLLVHKANNLKLTEGMFLEVVAEVAKEYPDIGFSDMLADTAASTFILRPESLDVVLTSHTIGDILSNVGAAVAGSLGLVGSLNSGDWAHVAEAAHGDAAELASQDRVNPIAFIEGVALLLRAIGKRKEFAILSHALADVRARGPHTLDLGGQASTSQVVDELCRLVNALREPAA